MNIHKRKLITILSFLMIMMITLVLTLSYSLESNAASIIDEGDAGTLHYAIDAEGVLTISGSGEMTESLWNTSENQPLIKSVVIDDGVTSISDNAFKECYRMQEIRIPNTVQTIGKDAFHDCIGLKKIVIPDSVKTIERCTFMGCTNLEQVVLPEGVETIGGCAFAYCKTLKSIYIPISVISIPNTGSEGSFMHCSSDMVIYCGAWRKPSGWNDDWNIYNYGSGYYNYLTVEYDITPEEYYSITHVHSYTDWIVEKNASCTENGSRYKECSECGDKITEIINKTGHSYGSWITTKAASEITTGERTHTCSSCGHTEKQTIAQLAPTLPAVKISKPKAAKKATTIKWKKVSKKNLKKIKKIEIQCSLDPSFKNGVITKYAKAKKTSLKIKKLQSKKKYYVRLRAYTSSGGTVHVSKWSSSKPVKVK